MKKTTIKVLALVVWLFIVSAPPVLAQDFCEGNFDYDSDQDGSDAFTFKTDFGRSTFGNPCPPDGPSPVPKTGQTTSYDPGDDGDLKKGVVWPNPRFTANVDNNGDGDCGDRGETCDGTVTDNLTGLIWLKNADCFGMRTWNNALSDSNGLSAGWCGLLDGSQAGDWRLPNYRELFSLIHVGTGFPALPSNPFTNVQSGYYWSSTGNYDHPGIAWQVEMDNGYVTLNLKTNDYYVWPVRGGQ